METNIENILVFATNIKTKEDKNKIDFVLSKVKGIIQWNIDQEDVDCVLRIVSKTLFPQQIIDVITFYNFHCKELD